MVLESEAGKTDPEIQKLTTLDIYHSFSRTAVECVREFEEQTRRAQVEKNRGSRERCPEKLGGPVNFYHAGQAFQAENRPDR